MQRILQEINNGSAPTILRQTHTNTAVFNYPRLNSALDSSVI